MISTGNERGGKDLRKEREKISGKKANRERGERSKEGKGRSSQGGGEDLREEREKIWEKRT